MITLQRMSALLSILAIVPLAVPGCGQPDYTGGTELIYEIQLTQEQHPQQTRDQIMAVIDHRLDFTHCRVQPGTRADTFRVQVPRSETDTLDEIEKHLSALGRLEFKLAMARNRPHFDQEYRQASDGETVKGYEKMYIEGDRSNLFILVREGKPEITGELLADADLTRDQVGSPAIRFEFNDPGSAEFAAMTERNRGWALAIILDGKLISAPVIMSRVPGKALIQGTFTQAEAQRIVRILRSGRLPAPVELVETRTIGAPR